MPMPPCREISGITKNSVGAPDDKVRGASVNGILAGRATILLHCSLRRDRLHVPAHPSSRLVTTPAETGAINVEFVRDRLALVMAP